MYSPPLGWLDPLPIRLVDYVSAKAILFRSVGATVNSRNRVKIISIYWVLCIIVLLLVVAVFGLREVAEVSDIPAIVVAEQVEIDRGVHDVALIEPEKGMPMPEATSGEKEVVDVPRSKGDLIFIIDDVGNNLEALERFLKFPGPLTFAVMPHRPYTAQAIELIKAAGKVAILHQPMEAVGGQNPGAGVIRTSMDRDEIWRTLDENFGSTGVLLGLNNHMGSMGTSSTDTMKAVLTYVKNNGMIFLDSVTTTNSVGSSLSIELGVRYIKRNSMFLDNEGDRQSVYSAIKAGEQISEEFGHAVMIGHVMTEALADLLFEMYPTFIEDGFTIKDLSHLLSGEVSDYSWD